MRARWNSLGHRDSHSSSASGGIGPSHIPRKVKHVLTDEQRQLYAEEKNTFSNFRWLAKLLGTPSSYVLTSDDLVSDDLQQELAELGQTIFSLVARTETDIFIKANSPSWLTARALHQKEVL